MCETGHYSAVITLNGIASTLELPNVLAGQGYSEAELFQLPFGTAKLFVGPSGGGLNVEWLLLEGESVLAQTKFSHLVGKRSYHLAMDWDLPNGEFRTFVNGVEQGDPFHGKKIHSLIPAKWNSSTVSAAQESVALLYEGRPVAAVQLSNISGGPGLLDPHQLIRDIDRLSLPSHQGEFRRFYHHALDLAALRINPIYATSFSSNENLIRERDLLDESGVRRREPVAGDWVLEGNAVKMHPSPTGVYFETALPDDKRDGAWVFWHNQELPDDFMIEYVFTPERSDRGLNIVFFHAQQTNGGSIFDLSLPVRAARFREYIVGAINNYHVSPWATDGERLRLASNLRKNSGFNLLAIGNDRIGQTAVGKTHVVRVLKQGSEIKVEADGIVVIESTDPGTVYGTVLTGGIAGLRFMAHTRSVTLHRYALYELEQ